MAAVSAAVLSLWAPLVLYMAGIFYASSLSQPPLPPGGDKPWHLLAYVGLAVLVVRAMAAGLPRRIAPATAAWSIAIGIAYAMSDEFHQAFVPGRTADVRDLVADALGVIVGTGLCWAWGIISATSRDEL